MTVTDAHHHVWDIAARPQPWLELPGNEPLRRSYELAEFRAEAVAAGVSASVVVQTVTDEAETRELLAFAAHDDLVAGVVGWADLTSDRVADALAALMSGPDGAFLRGIRHPVLTESDPGWLMRPAVRRGLAAVGAAGLTFDLIVPADLLRAATDAAVATPGVTFVLDHCGMPLIGRHPDEFWIREIRELAALPNTVCKLSGVLTEPIAGLDWCYQTVLTAFGPDRIMFGSDWPVCTVEAAYSQVLACAKALTAALSPAERSEIFGGTARRVYRLAD
jgi:L-fuconolactonase